MRKNYGAVLAVYQGRKRVGYEGGLFMVPRRRSERVRGWKSAAGWSEGDA